MTSAELETFDPVKHDVMVWLGCAGSFDADFQKSLKSMFAILRTCGVKFGVLSKEKCTGDPAKRTGNEYMFQELANANIADLKAAGPKKILTSCPHCVKTIGDDYKKFGYEVEIVHSSVYIEELTREKLAARPARATKVTFHDPAISDATPARSTSRARCWSASAPTSARSSAIARTRTAAARAAGCCSTTRKRSRARESATSASSSSRPPARTPS